MRTEAIADQKASPPNPAHAVRLALFLATATPNDTDATIETAAKIADNLAFLFGVAVIVGVAAEYLLPLSGYVAIWNWPGAAVAIGVAGEIAFARRGSKLSDVVSDRLKERLADAEKDASELRRKYAWRVLSSEQRATFHACLAQAAPSRIVIAYAFGDVESTNFAAQLGQAFINARWHVTLLPGTYGVLPAIGLVLPGTIHGGDERSSAIASALSQVGYEVSLGPVKATGLTQPQHLTPAPDAPPFEGDPAWMFVGPKPEFVE